MATPETQPTGGERSVYLTLTLIVQAILIAGLVRFVYTRDWENVFLTATVILLTLTPAFVGRRYRIVVPPEVQLVSAAFVFLSLYLGSAKDLYYKYWWWDVVLHTGSGFLLGMVGFVVLFLLNRTDTLPGMRPSFVCFFGVTFAVTLGVLWEVFEYAADELTATKEKPYGVNMQSRETGVADTMHDLLVDTGGAVIVAFMAYAYLRYGRYSFLGDGVKKFVLQNPRLFGHADADR